ncbi:MAG: UTP--glucose-1-phosphate uridylyltransferase [Candidatus Eremiobacteraeota bacterium]|nr:UTP--glucose-1-phosphate uridylyltransferase [Candidatus Eremiobacteraeota bacterium]MCW5866044.1 UTP--glucose-1-phosphate uridylyltransferase [Candidatus Eremiobacteraeota bacterium]
MRAAGLPEWQIDRFAADFARLEAGAGGTLAEEVLRPLEDLPRLVDLAGAEADAALGQTVVIKLNGGLGTSMGLETPKGLLEVRQGRSFLDLARSQVEAWRASSGSRLPLLLMNSFHTRGPSLEKLAGFSNGALPLDFLQSKVPKLRQDNLQPVEFPAHPELEWCPPGHGEIYAALRGEGMLDHLLAAGFRYAFVSNIDNLGATLDTTLLDWFSQSGLDFAMEVTIRTEQDKKGGHLARLASGQLTLRERSQCAPQDLPAFENIGVHRYFNTNNLWLRLEALREQPVPNLPLIVNRKTVDPTDPGSTPVYQLESAMGAAISTFPRTQAIEVTRRRFLPVKTSSDLLLLRSDLYRLDEKSQLQAVTPGPLPNIRLDPKFYSTYADFARRFASLPSLLECRSLTVEGDVHFGAGVCLQGVVEIQNPGPDPVWLP